jgi:hypothetical protein
MIMIKSGVFARFRSQGGVGFGKTGSRTKVELQIKFRCFGVGNAGKLFVGYPFVIVPHANRECTTGTGWNKRETAAEESYFNQVENDKRRELAEPVHRKELKSLLSILGDNSGFSKDQIQALLQWKRGQLDYVSDYQIDAAISAKDDTKT